MPEEQELFEEKKAEIKVEVPETAPPVEEEKVTEPEPEKVIEEIKEDKPEKPKKKKRQLTEAQKERLRDNLKRGRETSLANRKKKKKLKDIAKEEKSIEEDTKIFESLKKKLKPKELQEENDRLKAELAEMKKAKQKPKPERPLTPTPDVAENKKVEAQKMPTIAEAPKKKVLTMRQKRAMLKGL